MRNIMKSQKSINWPDEKLCDNTLDGNTNTYQFIRGSDPRVATCRGKLQNKRSKLNQEINKELRLRAGAENLFKATNNRKLKETVALELSFVNSNLQLLKEQLAELNSSVELYQSEMKEPVMPLIPLGLKETKEVDFKEPFKDFILEHYSEEGALYENEISKVMDLRQAIRTPLRDTSGISLLFQYYNQLYFIERRFFPPDRSLGIYFEWYDSLTGIPSSQRTVAFEKACVLFNIAAIYTQIAAKQDRKSSKGLDGAIDAFLRSSGIFRYICENFTNAPSMDLNSETLEMLGQLMLAQAKECLLEQLELNFGANREMEKSIELSQEASHVAEFYRDVKKMIIPLKDFIPETWMSLVSLKTEYYTAMSHGYCGMAMISRKRISEERSNSMKETQKNFYCQNQLSTKIDDEKSLLARAHIKESLLRFEETQRLQRMCRELKSKPGLEAVIRTNYSFVLTAFSKTEEENDFREVVEPPQILPLTKLNLTIIPPDFAHHRVDDLFKKLGPCAVFSAKHHWSAPRLVHLHRSCSKENFGFTLRSGCPVIIAGVESNSLADFGGIKEGDYIVAIAEEDVKWFSHDIVIALIKACGDSLSLKVVTPMNKNQLKTLKNHKILSGSICSTVICSRNYWMQGIQPLLTTITSDKQQKKLIWNPFKKQSFVDNIFVNEN